MKKLAQQVNDVFDTLDEDLLKEYYERSERKKQDEAWIKKYNGIIKDILIKQGKSNEQVGNIVVSVSVPDTSKFDEEKLLEYIVSLYNEQKISDEDYLKCLKTSINEQAIMELVENGVIDLEELKEKAWVQSTGTPRLNVKKLKGE